MRARPLGAAALVVLAACTAGAGPEAQPRPRPAPTATTSTSPYAASWSAVHADAANTDYSPVEGPDRLGLRWERRIEGSMSIGPLPWTINLGATVDPEGRLFVTTTEPGCHLHALDGATGETLWCAPDIDVLAVASGPLIDAEGHLYVADGTGLHALTRDGDPLWDVPLDGVPLSVQLTPDGHLVLVTHTGTLHVRDRDDGADVVEPLVLAPDLRWEPADGMLACARGTEECPAANTLAVDRHGRIFFTLWEPGAEVAGLRAVRYEAGPQPRLVPLWETDVLPGGSGSSPVLSADARRVYVTDNEGSLHALDASTGAPVWSVPIGYASGGSPSLSPDGLVVPAGGNGSPLLAVRDEGDRGTVAWRRDDLPNRGVATQTAGDKVYATIHVGDQRNDLVLLDARDGTEIDRAPIPGTSVFSVGTTVGPDGTIYVPTIVGGLFAFGPAG